MLENWEVQLQSNEKYSAVWNFFLPLVEPKYFYHCGIYHTYGLVDPTSMNCFAKTLGYLNATLAFCLQGRERQEIKYTCIVKKMQHFILDQEDTYM